MKSYNVGVVSKRCPSSYHDGILSERCWKGYPGLMFSVDTGSVCERCSSSRSESCALHLSLQPHAALS